MLPHGIMYPPLRDLCCFENAMIIFTTRAEIFGYVEECVSGRIFPRVARASMWS